MTVNCGLDAKYVLDEMQLYEVDAYLKGLEIRDRASWEQTRLIMYSMIQINSKKKIKLQDIIKFSWEKEDVITSVSNEEIDRIKEKAKQYGKRFSS